jgi:YHS domain-containing protein
MKTLLTLALLVSSFVASAADKPAEKDKGHDHGTPVVKPADDKKTEAAAKPYPLKTCIVSDNDLDSMGEQASFVYQGQTIKVCCKACIAKFEKNPAKYLKKLEGK